MPVSVGNEIQATQYNNLRTTVSGILNTNYGQSLISTNALANSTTVSSDKKQDLFLDIQRTQVHHTASLNNNIAVPPAGVTVSANTSQNYNQTTGVLSSVTDGEKMGYNDYEIAVNILSDFNPSTVDIWPVSNFTLGTATTSSRSTGWGGDGQSQSIYHVVTFTFASQTARDQYFNAGGELRFSASLTGGSGAKDNDWANLLSTIGTVRFSRWRLTASSGTPNAGGSGLNSLPGTGEYRLLFTKSGSGLYANNEYTIEGRISSATVLRFRIRFNDVDQGTGDPNFPEIPGIDESVGGTTSSVVNTFRPDSSFIFNSQPVTAVSLPAPSIATAVALTTNNATPPA
jgi:hypothetical protein